MIGIVGLLGFGAANAGPTEAQPQTITYEEALQGAVKGNAQLASALAARDQAEGGLIAARGQFDPVYSTNFNWRTSTQRQLFQQLGILVDFTAQGWTFTQSLNGNLPSGTSYNVDFNLGRDIVESDSPFGGDDNKNDNFTSSVQATVTQELLRGLRFQFNAQNVVSARTSLEVAELQLEVQRQEALYSAAEAYWGWVYQTELHEIALNSVAVAEEALRIGKLQVETGQLAPVEGTRLEAALVQAQQSALDAANTAEQAANVMLLAMARDPADVVAPGTQPGDVPAVELDPSAAVEVALVQNLDLLVARKNLDQAKIDVANARHSTLPSLSATATGSVGSLRTAACPETTTATPSQNPSSCVQGNAIQTVGALGAEDNQPAFTLGARFSIPIGNRASRGDVVRSTGLRWQREQELAALERQIGAQVEEQVRSLQSARQRMELADANRRLAEETLSAEEALASAGRTLQKDVLEARTEVDRTKAEAAKARTDYRLAQALLLKLQGQLTEDAPY